MNHLTTMYGVRQNPNELEAESGLTDSSRRGPQPWYTNFLKVPLWSTVGGERDY